VSKIYTKCAFGKECELHIRQIEIVASEKQQYCLIYGIGMNLGIGMTD